MIGLTTINIELTSRCNKNCWCCGRRKRERENPEVLKSYGDMDFSIVALLHRELQIYEGLTLQFHNNGEPLLYPRLKEVLWMFTYQIKTFDTNGKLLLERFDDIVDYLDVCTVSVIQGDPEQEEQLKILREFIKRKGDRNPLMVARLNGSVDPAPYKELGMIVATRILHDPMGSFNYTKPVTVPETGICLDLLHHLAVDRFGNVSCCVRFDPEGNGILGNVTKQSLFSIWNGAVRKMWITYHLMGKRDHVALCKNCDYWGVPTGWNG